VAKISIIVPTYNRPEMLDRALRSIQAQTMQDYEIIVVNDAGEDVSEIVGKYPKASYYEHEENKGLAGSRNTGMRHAKGKYICFLDDDDVLFPIHFQILSDELDKGTEAAYTDAYRWENESYVRLTLSVDYSKNRLWAGCPFYVMNVMLNRDIIKGHWFDESLPSHEDYDLWITLAEHDVHFKHIKAITAAYSHRGDGSQISHKPYHSNYFDIVRKRHGIDFMTPVNNSYLKNWGGGNGKGKYRVLVNFVGLLNGNSEAFRQGRIMEMSCYDGNEYARAGFVERIG